MSLTGVSQRYGSIDEETGVFAVVILAEFSKERVEKTFVLVGLSFVWSNSFVFGSTATSSQYCPSLRRITATHRREGTSLHPFG